jgi:hypothetical protein
MQQHNAAAQCSSTLQQLRKLQNFIDSMLQATWGTELGGRAKAARSEQRRAASARGKRKHDEAH